MRAERGRRRRLPLAVVLAGVAVAAPAHGASLGGTVSDVVDGDTIKVVTRDRYGRLLAYVYRPGSRGPTGSVNWSLVRSGHAKVYVYGGTRFRHAVPFFRAENRARRSGAGLWGPPCRGDTTKPDPSVRATS